MRNWIWPLATLLLLAFSTSHGIEARQRPKGIFSSLKVGQAVTLNDHGTVYSISFLDEGLPLTHKIVEVGEDYVIVEDARESNCGNGT